MVREKEFGTDDGDIVEGLLWRDEPEFGSTEGIWRLADVEGAITNFMESENLTKCSHLTDCRLPAQSYDSPRGVAVALDNEQSGL